MDLEGDTTLKISQRRPIIRINRQGLLETIGTPVSFSSFIKFISFIEYGKNLFCGFINFALFPEQLVDSNRLTLTDNPNQIEFTQLCRRAGRLTLIDHVFHHGNGNLDGLNICNNAFCGHGTCLIGHQGSGV